MMRYLILAALLLPAVAFAQAPPWIVGNTDNPQAHVETYACDKMAAIAVTAGFEITGPLELFSGTPQRMYLASGAKLAGPIAIRSCDDVVLITNEDYSK